MSSKGLKIWINLARKLTLGLRRQTSLSNSQDKTITTRLRRRKIRMMVKMRMSIEMIRRNLTRLRLYRELTLDICRMISRCNSSSSSSSQMINMTKSKICKRGMKVRR